MISCHRRRHLIIAGRIERTHDGDASGAPPPTSDVPVRLATEWLHGFACRAYRGG
jgi:hypothetical protein